MARKYALLPILLLKGSNNMLNFALICHIHTFQSKNKNITKHLEFLAKQGISGQNKEKQNNDKNPFHLPRQEFLFCLNLLILCGFPHNRRAHYNDFTTFEKCSDMTKWETHNICVSPVFHSCNMITSL